MCAASGQNLHLVVAGTGDEVVLQVGGQVDEVGAVPGDADDEVTILLRILLGLLQGIGVDDVELDVPQLEVAPGAVNCTSFSVPASGLQRTWG